MLNKKIVKICVFNKNASKNEILVSNGDEILDSICTFAEMEENLETGEHYLDASFIIDSSNKFKHLQEEAVLKVQVDYGNEYFEIASVRKTPKEVVVFARQVTIAETLDLWLEDVRPENQNGQGALGWILSNAKGKKDIRVFSDISKLSTAYYMNMNMYQALHDCDQSFSSRWGGEIQRRGYDLTINERIGTHRSVQIRSGKSLTGFEANTNIDNVVTRIKPVGFDGITIDGYIDSLLIGNYKKVKTREIKYDDVKVKDPQNADDEGFGTLADAQKELKRRATLEFTENHIDELIGDYRINFVQLEQTEEYKNYVQAERVFLGDSLDVYEEKHDISLTVRAVRRKFDILNQRVKEVELTNAVKREKPPSIGDVLDGLDKIENEIVENNKWFQDAIDNATDLIQSGLKDSYVIVRKNEILIMDTKDINTAINVWRWNKGGLGFSSTGYYGSYETAITQDGKIVAKFLTGLIVQGEQIDAKNLNVYNAEGSKTLEVTSHGDITLRPKIFEIIAGSTTNIFTKDEVDKKVDSVLEGSKTYTNTQIKVVNDSISERVTKTEYDENNNVLNQKFVDVTKSVDGIKETVEVIEGDYATKSSVTQLSDRVEHRFEQSGSENLLKNSAFLAGTKNWYKITWENNDTSTMSGEIRTTKDFGWIPNGKTALSILNNGSANNNHYIGAQQIVAVEPWQTYTWSFYIISHRAKQIRPDVKNADTKATIKSYAINVSSGIDSNPNLEKHWTRAVFTFTIPADCKRIELNIWAVGRDSNTQYPYAETWVCDVQLEKGDKASKWRANPNEVYSNTTIIDPQGIAIVHNNNSKTRIDHETVEFTHSNGNKVLRIKDGGMNFFTWDMPEMVGFIKPSSLESNRYSNGVSLSTYNLGDYISIGCSSSANESEWTTMPYLTVCPADLGQNGYSQGVNLNQRAVNWNTFINKYKINNEPNCGVNFAGNTAYDSQIYGYSGGVLVVAGDNDLRIGVREGATNKTNINIVEQSGQPYNCRIDMFGKVNQYGTYSIDGLMGIDLKPQSNYLKSRLKDINQAYVVTSLDEKDIRFACREVQHISPTSLNVENNTLVHSIDRTMTIELPQILSENIESDYHVNISKMSWGDYRIIEKTAYYFIIETNVDDFSFTYEVVAKLKEDYSYKFNTSIASMQYLETERAEPPKPAEPTFVDITEVSDEVLKKSYEEVYEKREHNKMLKEQHVELCNLYRK